MQVRSPLLSALLGIGVAGILGAQPVGIEARKLLYSGFPDPQIVFTSSSDIGSLRPFLTGLPPAPAPAWPVSGFRGFLLLNRGVGEFPLEVTVFGGIVKISDGPNAAYFQDVQGLEQRLQSLFASTTTGGANVDFAAARMAPPVRLNADPGLPTSGSEPPFSPDDWNNDVFTKDDNNCYNYACNKPTGTYARPGRAAHRETTRPYTCSSALAGSLWDGLILWSADIPCPGGCYKIALVVDPGTSTRASDFHWLRQDQGGTWSQKHGFGPAINTDDGVPGMPITDPRSPTTNRGTYTDFCGFYCVAADPNMINISSLWPRPLLQRLWDDEAELAVVRKDSSRVRESDTTK